MARPITNDYISATEKSFISSDSNGKMIEKNIIEIEGKFLLKICDNVFHGMDGEDVYKHINSFLEVVEPLKIRGLSHDRFRLSVFHISLSGATSKWFTKECISTISTWDNIVENFILKFHDLCEHDEETYDEDYDPHKFDNVPEIFKIDDDLFYFDLPLSLAFEELNPFLKIDPNLFTYDIQGFMTYDEYEQELNNKTQVDEEPWHGPYANVKTEKTHDPYLDTTRISGRNYEASNVGDTQENQGHDDDKDDPTPELPTCKIRRFEMIKYSFHDGEEYISMKESEHLNHSKPSLDAYQELLRLIKEGWVVTSPDEQAK
ncbi:hypothetical protein Tco_1117191 [Tanacetum coccineum]